MLPLAHVFSVSYYGCFMTIFLLSLNYLDGGTCKMLGKMYILVISSVFFFFVYISQDVHLYYNNHSQF